MSIEDNKAVVRRVVEDIMNQRNLALVDELFAADYVDHAAFPGQAPGAEGVRQFYTQVFAAFRDARGTIDDVIAEGDKVVVRLTIVSTHVGEFMGVQGTGKQVTLSGIEILRLTNARITESWAQSDMLGFLQQLGALPAPGQTPA